MLYRKKALHTHQCLENKSSKLTEETKQQIIEYYNDGKKPTAISFKFRGKPGEQPSIHQIKNEIDKFKKKEYGKNPITMRQLQDFINQHTEMPDDIDESFIVIFERSPPDEKEKYFRFFISTRRLLAMAANAKNIHADSTHKVTTEKLPLIVIGSTDIQNKFHLIGVTVTSHERAVDYEMSFKAVKLGVQKVTGAELIPNALICDADPAIHNGFKQVFNNETITIMCYAHVMSNVHRKYKFKDNNNRKLIEDDLRIIHKCYDEYTFDIACQLFIEKWTEKEGGVTKRIKTSFFAKNKNWYIGCIKRVPKTNNSLERFNGLLKQQQLNHQKKPLKQFKKIALRIVRERSNEYKIDKTTFQEKLEVTTKMIRKGKEHNKKYVYAVNENGETDFYMFASIVSGDDTITMNDVELFKAEEYSDFDDFAAKSFRIHKITFPENSEEWENAICTCPSYDKEYMCKHIISIAHQVIKCFPENYDDEPLFTSKRGRPKRISKALAMD